MRHNSARELKVFRDFAAVAGLLGQDATIESRSPPEPDVLLSQASGEAFAFELVEILDRGYSASLQREFDTKRLCDDAIVSLPAQDCARFRSEFANAHISLSFIGDVSTQVRKNVLPRLFAYLLTLPSGHSGRIDMPHGSLASALQHIRIDRLDINGPLFATMTGTWVGDPTVEAIAGKFAKTYSSTAPLNLLAYIAGNPQFPESVWLPKLEEFLSTVGSTSQFAHIYVYDTGAKKIKLHWVKVNGR